MEKDGVHVEFACTCMTFDQSPSKFWYHGEYEPLDILSVEEKLKAHDLHCSVNANIKEVVGI
jgi:hypothetical protein|tara:strand:- start:1615 stop:1800 length:186 start_codon:yes stop_codon:yes gene_type:complete